MASKTTWALRFSHRSELGRYRAEHGTPAQLAAAIAGQAAALSYADAFLVTGVLALVVTPGVLLLARKHS